VQLPTRSDRCGPDCACERPPSRPDFERLVPADKRLDPAWVRSLFDRGTPQVFRGDDLRYIGMPVGGLCAGQVYLGGDGRLWHWDIFNRTDRTVETHYAHPPTPASPFELQFALIANGQRRTLDARGFADVTFRGEYPIGVVSYADPAAPIEVRLEAFSPFIPLNTDDSSLPAIVMSYTLRNRSASSVDVEIDCTSENPVCHANRWHSANLCNRPLVGEGICGVEFAAEPSQPGAAPRADLLFEDWNRPGYGDWTVEGTAFGTGPVLRDAIPSYIGDVGGAAGPRVVNSHASAPGESMEERDRARGRLVSRSFVIERRYVNVWVGGGRSSPGSRHGVTVVVEGAAVATLSGADFDQLAHVSFDLLEHLGRTAHIEIVDDREGHCGNVGVGNITLSDSPAVPLTSLPDFGTMAIAALSEEASLENADVNVPFPQGLVARVAKAFPLAAGEERRVTFVVTWRFPNLSVGPLKNVGRHYASRFASAGAVARYVVENFARLDAHTRLWRDTWYDSTLPYWFLDRTFLNTSTLATSTCFRFADGRFYGWEGVGCCAGTCGHVYHYAHAIGRLFPDLERDLRERVDFGIALRTDGSILFRGELNDIPAIDAQAGSVLRTLREHQMSADASFLHRNWPQVRRATQWLIAQDADRDGLIDGRQHNTLDSDWFGPIAWLSGLYLAALQAAAAMADEVQDAVFACECRDILAVGRHRFVDRLFDGEYFVNEVDPSHADAINSGTGCAIDQVFGQSWAFQVGLPRVLPVEQTRSALRALWRYNFTPDVGAYRAENQPGRWYAMPGEAGLLICTFPRVDWDFVRAAGKGHPIFVGYFNECMNGFEYQVAGHMIWEGLVLEGLAITRAVHDRYHASGRNPWNEVECGDHYARSMASYGVFLAACGYSYHGPHGELSFAPRVSTEDFQCAFTASEGWGTFAMSRTPARAEVSLKWGKLRLKRLSLAFPQGCPPTQVQVKCGNAKADARLDTDGSKVSVAFEPELLLGAGERLLLAFA
jgi:non-lysosomal glucosylceramidase